MSTIITVTKVASAYPELEHDFPAVIDADSIQKMIPLSPNEELGGAILFLADGSTMNVTETIHEIIEKANNERKDRNLYLFGMN